MDRKNLIIAGLIFAVLLGYVLITQTGNRGFNTVKLPSLPKVEADAMERIEVTRPQGRLVLEKKNKTWTLAEPLVFPADKNKVESAQRAISDLWLTDLITEQDTRDADFGLTSGTAMGLRVKGAKNQNLELTVGKLNAAGTHTFVRRPGDRSVYQVLGDLISAFNAPAPEWRSLQVYGLSTEVVQNFSVTLGKKSLQAARAPEAAANPITAPGNTQNAKTIKMIWKAEGQSKPLSDAKVDQWINAFTRLSANRIVDAPGTVKNPLAQIQVKTLQAEYTLEFLEYKSKEKVYWVRRGGETTVYELPDYQGQNLLKEAKDLL
jgi:hypothetical protein